MSHAAVLDLEDKLKYIITHVFFPLQLPGGNDHSIPKDHSLAGAIANTAKIYCVHVGPTDMPQWKGISKMLDNLEAVIKSESTDALSQMLLSQFPSVNQGDVLALHIRAQNAGVVFRKQSEAIIVESFELSPKAEDVMSTEDKLICSYPGPAIEIPNVVFDDDNFRSELVNFLVHMHYDDIDADATTNQRKRTSAFRDTIHPRYITELLTGILRSVGRPSEVPRIRKRVGDDVVCNDESEMPWRRSALWLLVRVALQTTLDRSSLGRDAYKEFMLFFMCRLASDKICANLPSDLLQFMSAKISRRLRKLDSSASDWLSDMALRTCTHLRAMIESRWEQVQAAQRRSPSWNPSRLNLVQDIQLSLSNSSGYLRNMRAGHNMIRPQAPFNRGHRPRGGLDDFFEGSFFEAAYRTAPHITLYDVERAVEEGIDTWVGRITNADEACVQLVTLAEKYSSNALEAYASNPELLSVMLLTTIELWMALDKIVIKEIPILADYSPEIPTSLLENLLLWKTTNLRRLRSAHEYLSRRHARTRDKFSVFSSSTTKDSFPNRFYRTSSRHQRLKTKIEEVARREVREKMAELEEMNARYAALQKMEAETDQANMSMRIFVHEWPLPSSQIEAEAIVFELDCPIAFDMWRAATFCLLVDLCSPYDQSDAPRSTLLNEDRALKSYLVKHPKSRITLSFDTKAPAVPAERSSEFHELRSFLSKPPPLPTFADTSSSFLTSSPFSQPSVSIPAQKAQVCIKSKWTFIQFSDTRTGLPVCEPLGRIDGREHCTYRLQTGPYYSLQKYVDSTLHTSNEVIAYQSECHEDLSIHEYMAFGHLRSGGLLQWLNILRELRARSLNFRRPEVHMLFAQAVSQVGPISGAESVWHKEIRRPLFCRDLLRELESLVRDVETNWMEGVTMDTISLLLRRMLGFFLDHPVWLEAVKLLRTVRGKVFAWVQELSARLQKTPGDGVSRDVLRDTAAICRGTYDVVPALIPNVLHSAEDVDIFLYCGIMIHDHTPRDLSHLSLYSQLLLHRDRRLSLTLENTVSSVLQADHYERGINLSIGRIWPNFDLDSKWAPLPSPNSRWFSCMTTSRGDQHQQVLHFNILNGLLLIDGKPLGTWLPEEYTGHPLYKLIFGDQMLEVLPSNLPGTEYSTRNLISGHQVYLSLQNHRSDLVVRARPERMADGNSSIIELIPYERLKGDLPTVLIEGHAHWYDLSNSIVEVRPLGSLWETSLDNWRIDYTPGSYRMWKGRERLVDIRSKSWHVVSCLLKPLGAPEDLIVSATPTDARNPTSSLRLSVRLPRYDLAFYVDDDGDLQSHDIRGMVYDKDQSVGTFFGLVNQLVLRPKNKDVGALEIIPRCVLIPEGDISYQMDGHHVRVEVIPHFPTPNQRIACHVYRVNPDLGCITGNGTLTSKLYCAYLHALTSGSSDDPLTGRSGTEEALSVLQSVDCCPTIKFSPRDAELLCSIASVCPIRAWIPGCFIQKVEWRNLPANVHNNQLYAHVKTIKERYEELLIFYESPSSVSFQEFPLQNDHLLARSARRSACLHPFLGISEQQSGSTSDVQYTARDVVDAASGEHRVYTAAAHVYRRTATSTKDVWRLVESWAANVSGDSGLSLRYDKMWLAPDLPSIWLKAYNLLRSSDDKKWFQLLFSLPAMAHASPNLCGLVPVLVAFASHPEFRFEDPPDYDSYPSVKGSRPSFDTLRKYVIDSAYPLNESPERLVPAKERENVDRLQQRRLQLYNSRRRSDANVVAQSLLDSWPCETPPSCSLNPKLYDLAGLETKIQDLFSNFFRKIKLEEHFMRVQAILNESHANTFALPDGLPYLFTPSQAIPPSAPWTVRMEHLFSRPVPPLPAFERLPRYPECIHHPDPASSLLDQLITAVDASAENTFQRQYVSALYKSAKSFANEIPEAEPRSTDILATFMEHYTRCRASYIETLSHLRRHLGPRNQGERAVEQSGQWPRFSAYVLFRCFASNSEYSLPDNWKKTIISFALRTLELQRVRRLILLHFDNLHEELWKELQNEGCDGWDAEAQPEWLLIQLQGNFLIRRIQADVANEMTSPRSGNNTAMQLNMGEGKTSVIVPIVASVLANGNQLVRVVVPKPLTVQTLHLLTDRLGGLTNRRIYYLPFTRSVKMDDEKVASFWRLLQECVREGGIVVVQPEHILSLKLVSVEKQLSPKEDNFLASQLIGLQRWLDTFSRDILDESDEILDVRSQLVFTIGQQQHIQGSHGRWTTTQQVLGLVSRYASVLRDLFPFGVEYESGPPGSFPHLRILQSDAAERLVSWIVREVMDGLLPNVSFGQLHLHPGLEEAIQKFISYKNISPDTVQFVKRYSEKTLLWNCLLLLRGLLVYDTLLFALRERRWRVDYGLAPARTLLAVPYRAKDVPAQRAEFGHPDVTIILTCLSYYYTGLSDEQLKLSFEMLLKEHDASLDYDLWIRTCPTVPESLRTLRGVNMESVEQWDVLYPLFSRNRATIDYYLSRVVFPKEAKEFPFKLSGSSWDLAEKKERLVTGFSGTSDGQYLFPLGIVQHDPDHQRGTNGKVLSYILRPENKRYMRISYRRDGKRRSSRGFLRILASRVPEIRVLLDVGAQMLDLQNYEVAEAWLEVNKNASAAVYFNEFDELMVRTRDGSAQTLLSSPYAERLDQCVVYLDDTHTRGTDIKFPSGFRAAIMLGPKVTKDRLVQGCMRMRKLGHGHSLMFFAPPDVDRRIRSAVGKAEDSLKVVETIDILHWTIRETWQNVQRWAPHWAQQGMDHASRYTAWSGFCKNEITAGDLSGKWLQREAKGLENLYLPHSSDSVLSANGELGRRCFDLGITSLSSVGMDEEQERELIHELDTTQSKLRRERFPSAIPARHSVHRDVVSFVKTGHIPSGARFFRKSGIDAFVPVFDSLHASSAAADEAYVWSQSLLATEDFAKTLAVPGTAGNYLRPVNWVVSAKRGPNDMLVVLSPYEVNELLPDIRTSDKVHLHIYTPRIIKSMRPCDDLALALHSIPTVPHQWLPPYTFMDQLSVFAGQLYLKDHASYIRLCRFLGVYARDLEGIEGIVTEPDGFILPKNRNRFGHARTEIAHTFAATPLVSLRALMTMRNQGINFASTHMGKILDGHVLSYEDFQ